MSRNWTIALALTSFSLYSEEGILQQSETPNLIEESIPSPNVAEESEQNSPEPSGAVQSEPAEFEDFNPFPENNEVSVQFSSKPPAEPPPVRCHKLQVGANFTYAWITPTDNFTTTGSMGGAQGLYEYCPDNSVYIGAYFGWRMGPTTNELGAVRRTIQDFNLQERLGYTFVTEDKKNRATLFSGIGARYLPETVTIEPSFVDFTYTDVYVPVGCLLERQWTPDIAWGINFQWLPQIFPTVHMTPLGGARWSLIYQINNFFVETPLKITCCDRISCVISPFFELWHDGASTATTINTTGGTTELFSWINGAAANQNHSLLCKITPHGTSSATSKRFANTSILPNGSSSAALGAARLA
jgi:hypothetical protein